MIEPDFGEAQFQQLLNTELAGDLARVGIHPIIPTPQEESYLGWDTGFNIPFLKPPDSSQKDCNLFLQYKLAVVMTGKSAGEWDRWQEPYFRFRVAHWKRDGHYGKWHLDFHQFEAMRVLADNGFPTFYVSNATADLSELLQWASQKVLVDASFILNVAEIGDHHVKVPFLKDVVGYHLSSLPEEGRRVSRKLLIDLVRTSRSTSLQEDLELIPVILGKHPDFVRVYDSLLKENESRLAQYKVGMSRELKWLTLRRAVLEVLGLTWWKLAR